MQTEKSSLRELAGLFLKLGLTSFGGPVAHIAMMQKEVVEKRNWMDHAHFMDLIGATNIIPGPNSTEMAIHIGHERAGWKGLLVAGSCFILPAVMITGVIAYFYQLYGQLPEVRPFIYGLQPAVIAIILSAVFPLAKHSLKNIQLAMLGLLSLAASLAGFNEVIVMFGAGLIMTSIYLAGKQKTGLRNLVPLVLINIPLFSQTNMRLFWVFLKIGAILYGSGYVLFAFLDSELVANGILSRHQLIDAIAVGQFTPGPLFSSVTFIGWQINGWQGAITATIAVFLSSFVFVVILNPLVPRLRKSTVFSSFLDGVNIASVAIIFTVCIHFCEATFSDWRQILIAVISLIIVFKFRKVNTVFLIIGGSALSYFLSLF